MQRAVKAARMNHAALASVVCVVLALVAIGGCGPSVRRPPVLVKEPAPLVAPRVELVRQDGLPGESYAVLTRDGAWSWFGDPRAVSHHGEYRRTFAGWVNSAGDVVVAQFDHDTGEVRSTVVHEKLQKDDHASPALLMRPDGRLMAFYCGHRGRWMIYRISAGAEDVTEWGRAYAASGHTSDVRGYTYPNAALLSAEDDRRYLFWRGAEYLPTFSVSETGMTWSEPAALISGGGERPYLKVASDGIGTMHFAFTDDHPRNAPGNNIYYVRYRSGSLERADGTVVAAMDSLPISPGDADLVYDAAAGEARAWVWDVAFDDGGDPVIVYAVFPYESEHRYRYARWNGSAWENHDVAIGGSWFPTIEEGRRHFEPYYSGGVVLDPSDPSVVYLSRPVQGVFEIERWTTPDGGTSWLSEPVTSGSAANNVRPFVPRGHAPDGPGLIWMHGEYTDYTAYATSLRMK